MTENVNQAWTFNDEVQIVLGDLLQMDLPDWISAHRGASELYEGDVQAYGPRSYAIPHLSKLKWFSRKLKDAPKAETEFEEIDREFNAKLEVMNEIAEDAAKATEVLNRKSLRDQVCLVLTKGVDDFFDIAKCITPVLVGASLAGTLPFRLNPLIVALATLMIVRIGIDKLCKDKVEVIKEK